ncbi:MAG TPA: polysaccharide biosynthesis protein [Gammaproteobacteria bacterium]|nr:polysaccharide biosynthesis protein [Gammaproteobacteria bacterium]
MTERIPLARTDIGDAEVEGVSRVMESGRLALGEEMRSFEQSFADYHGVSGAVMVNSGTSGLMISLQAQGVGSGDEVIVPALTFVGSINAILAVGATPVLVDVERDSANIDPNRVRGAVSSQSKSIMPVHLYGLPASMSEILNIAQACELTVIEDACEAIGADYDGNKVGSIGDAGVFGFYPNKVLTTGEGGMVISNDATLLARCRAMVNQGRGEETSVPLGYSLRGSELSAAIGRAQLTSLDTRISEREQIALRYVDALAAVPEVHLLSPNLPRSWFTFPVLLPDGVDRARVKDELGKQGIASAEYFPAIQTLPVYKERIRASCDLLVSEDIGRRVLCLPFWRGVEVHIPEIIESLANSL